MVNVALVGPELTLNTNRVDALVLDGLAVNAAGDVLAGWDLNALGSPDLPDPQFEGEDLAVKLFSPALSAIKAEFDPASFVQEDQSSVQVTALTNGSFVVVFQSLSASLGESGNYDSIRALIVNASGTVTTPEFLVNAANDGNIGNQELPSVAALAGGGFVVTWSDMQTNGVVGQAFNAGGAKVGAETVVDLNASMVGASEVAALQNGDFVVAWQEDGVDPTGAKLALQLYSPSFAKIGGTLSLNPASSQQEAHVVALSDGRFAAVWDDEVTSGSGVSTTQTRHVMAQFFNPDGSKAGAAFSVETQGAGLGYLTDAKALDNGQFAAVWTSFGAAESLHLQIIATDGSKVGSEQIVATGAPGETLGDAAIANLGGGKLLVAWDDQAGAGSYVAVKSQQIAYGASAPSPTLATLDAAFANVLQVDPASTLANTPTIALAGGSSVPNPAYLDAQTLASLAAQVDGGQTTLAAALNTIEHYGDATTSVATVAYEFFTGATPSAGGYAYLINSAANPDNLNTAYYAKFNEENRYINFAVNLGKDGAGMASFQAAYGSLSLADAMTKAYAALFGFAPAAGKISDILGAVVGPNETRADYFAAYGLDGPSGIGTKAAGVGWLMVEAVEADLGTYAQANDLFLNALAGGTAQFNVDLLGVYGGPAPAGFLSLGTTYPDALSAAHPTNAYQFELTAGERYQFVMSGAGTGSNTLHFPALGLAGPGGASLTPIQASSAAPYVFDFTPATSGAYTITAETLGGGSGTYSLVANDIRGGSQLFESVGVAGATFGGAAPVGTVGPGAPIHIASTIRAGIEQIYHFTVPAAGAQVELDANAPSGLELTLLDSGLNVVGHAVASNAGFEQILAQAVGGDYYLELTNSHAVSVNYDLHFWG